MYGYGRDVSHTEGKKWLKKAAESGHTTAECAVCVCVCMCGVCIVSLSVVFVFFVEVREISVTREEK